MVAITTNEVTHVDTKVQTSSTVYHSLEINCSSGPAEDSEHRAIVPEKMAITFGRHLCGSCVLALERKRLYDEISQIAKDYIGISGLAELLYALPDGFEVRILAHGFRKSPIVVWSQKGMKQLNAGTKSEDE